MGRNNTYKRQRAHVLRENPKFFQLGENGDLPNRNAVVEEFDRLLADDAYGRNPKVGADRPEGGIILLSPPLKAVDLNKPVQTNAGAAGIRHTSGEVAEKVKKELGGKPKDKRPSPADLVLEPKEAHMGSFLREDVETPVTPGFDWAADLEAHGSSPEKPVQSVTNKGDTAPETFEEEQGWSTVRSKGSARGKRATVLEQPSAENRGCFNCGEEGHRKADCTAPSKSGGRACHNCGEEGHFARECPTQGGGPGMFAPTNNNRSCYNCNQAGHIARDCPTGGPGKGGAECFNCGEVGHKSFECSKGSGSYGAPRFGSSGGGRGGRRGPSTCNKCGEPGHFARECPQGSGFGSGSFGSGGYGSGGFEGPFEPFPSFDNAGFETGFDSGYGTGFDSGANDDGYGW